MFKFKLEEPEERILLFYGKIIDQMPEIRKENMISLSFADLMQKRLESLTEPKIVTDYWWNNYFFTGDAAILNSDGRVKLVLDATFTKALHPKSELGDNLGELVLSQGFYPMIQGIEFTRDEIERKNNAEFQLSKEEAKSHPIWKALAREDQGLLDDYVDAVFYKAKKMYGYDKNMRLWVQPPPLEGNSGLLWTVSSLKYKSQAWAKHSLNNRHARLIGVEQTISSLAENIIFTSEYLQEKTYSNPNITKKTPLTCGITANVSNQV